jgi:uncharacterized protein YndB with AHSA1/START domain
MDVQTEGTRVNERIQKKALLHARPSRVWRAIADPKEFGAWFGMQIEGSFDPGSRVVGRITPTTADPEIAKQQKEHEGLEGEMLIDRVEPERLLTFRWHPFATDPSFDYSGEPTTVVSFELEEAGNNTLLSVTESGFDRLPVERRTQAFAANEQGWGKQMELIEKYVAQS